MKNFIRFFLQRVLKVCKVSCVWLKNPRRYPKVVLYVSNHVSALDIIFLYAFLPDGICFAIDELTCRKRYIRFLMRYADVVPFNPLEPNDAKMLQAKLEKGQSCVLFAEGKITETGNLMKIYEAPGVIADRAKVPFVPVWIEGAQYGYFSNLKEKKNRRLLPRTTITFQKPVPFRISELGRKNRNYISNEIYQLMQNVAFRSTFRPTASVFAEFMRAAKSNAHDGIFSRPLVAEDIERIPYSYKDLTMKAYLYAKQLNPFVPRQHTMGILLPNSVDTFCVLLGLMAYERVPAMLNYTSGNSNVLSAIRTSGAKVVLTSAKFVEENKLELLIENIKLQGILVIYIEQIKLKMNPFRRLQAWILYKKKYVPFPFSASKRALILFTSGSTGQPKAIVLSHQNLVANIRQFSAAIDINKTDIVFNCLPMFHCFGLVIGTFYPLLSGGRVFIYPTPLHYRAIPEFIYNIGATMLFGTDTFLQSYAKVAHPFDFDTLRFVLGAAEPVQKQTRDMWMEKFGIRVFEGYGATECSPFLTVNNRIFCNFNSVGKLLPEIEYKLKPIDGIDGAGSLCVKGPNIMLGYMTSDRPTEIIRPAGAWFDTGDVVSVDDMGFFYIKGRLRRFAKIAGEMVSLPMVEKLVKDAYPDLDCEVAAVSVPHPTKGEQIVVASTSRKITLDALLPFVIQQGFSELYVPKAVVYKREIPVLASGKRDYITLQKQIAETFK